MDGIENTSNGIETIANALGDIGEFIFSCEINKIIDNCKKQGCINGKNCMFNPDSVCYIKGAYPCVFSHDILYVPTERQKRLDGKKYKGPYDHLIVDPNNSNK